MSRFTENDKNDVTAVAEKLKEVPDNRRDYIAGVLDGFKRAEEMAAEKKTA